MGITLLVLTALTAAPHAVIVERTVLEVPRAKVDAVLEEVRAKLGGTLGQACPRGDECLAQAARAPGVDVAVGVSLASGPRRITVDLEALDPWGTTVATWTGKLPLNAPDFFAAVAHVRVAEPPPPPPGLRPATPLFISAAVLAAGAFATGITGAAVRGPLDARLQMTPVISGLTRESATQQVNQVNALVTTCLILGLAAAGLTLAGVLSLLF